jgi:hypothetical protein
MTKVQEDVSHLCSVQRETAATMRATARLSREQASEMTRHAGQMFENAWATHIMMVVPLG